ncbi:MAG: aspartate/glutamate racemase family protein [Kiritimatiellae bacterium]|nr:aspartate/glutamate racemase family protein [Kiritimatiellia bacterium]
MKKLIIAVSFVISFYSYAKSSSPIGVFDSGIGGMTVLEKMLTIDNFDNVTFERKSDGRPDFEGESFIYFGDQANMPYGDYAAHGKSEYLKRLIVADAEFLLSKEAKSLVIACNTATAWGLTLVRERSAKDDVETTGVIEAGVRSALTEPTAVNASGGFTIGVMATPGTIASSAYERTVKEQTKKMGVTGKVLVFSQGCAGLADAVEAGLVDAEKIAVENFRALKAKADAAKEPLRVVILGCTHYPFVLDALQNEAPNVKFVDPSLATAEECYLSLKNKGLLSKNKKSSLKVFISVPRKDLDKKFLDENGSLTRECKYGRDINDKTLWTEVKPYTSVDAAKNNFISRALPAVSKMLKGENK